MKRYALLLLLIALPLGAQNTTLQTGVDGAQYVPVLSQLLGAKGTESEMRDIVNRFTADENALGRRWNVEFAPARRERFRE